jgi:mRNA-degrading endonuclease RelE of RelBE toxin-antitoxin system
MVIITPEAEKQYNKLPIKEKQKIRKKYLLIENEPMSGKKLSGQFAELRSLQAWPYRIIYLVKKSEVFIVTIAHRQGVYK